MKTEIFNCGVDSHLRVFLEFTITSKSLYPNDYLEINEEDAERLEQAWLERRRIKVVNALFTDNTIQYIDLSAVVSMKFVPPKVNHE